MLGPSRIIGAELDPVLRSERGLALECEHVPEPEPKLKPPRLCFRRRANLCASDHWEYIYLGNAHCIYTSHNFHRRHCKFASWSIAKGAACNRLRPFDRCGHVGIASTSLRDSERCLDIDIRQPLIFKTSNVLPVYRFLRWSYASGFWGPRGLQPYLGLDPGLAFEQS